MSPEGEMTPLGVQRAGIPTSKCGVLAPPVLATDSVTVVRGVIVKVLTLEVLLPSAVLFDVLTSRGINRGLMICIMDRTLSYGLTSVSAMCRGSLRFYPPFPVPTSFRLALIVI